MTWITLMATWVCMQGPSRAMQKSTAIYEKAGSWYILFHYSYRVLISLIGIPNWLTLPYILPLDLPLWIFSFFLNRSPLYARKKRNMKHHVPYLALQESLSNHGTQFVLQSEKWICESALLLFYSCFTAYQQCLFLKNCPAASTKNYALVFLSSNLIAWVWFYLSLFSSWSF